MVKNCALAIKIIIIVRATPLKWRMALGEEFLPACTVLKPEGKCLHKKILKNSWHILLLRMHVQN